jgi:hypothetical protein
MNKTLPTKENTLTLIAEDVRREIGNKLTILGWYGGKKVNIEDWNETSVIPSLAVLFQFRDGAGEFATRLEVIGPDGQVRGKGDMGTTIKTASDSAVVVAFLRPFKVPALGTYTVRIYLDDHPYEAVVDVGAGKPMQDLSSAV